MNPALEDGHMKPSLAQHLVALQLTRDLHAYVFVVRKASGFLRHGPGLVLTFGDLHGCIT